MNGTEVRERREALGLSRRELAELSDTTHAAVATVERDALPRGGQPVVDKITAALESPERGITMKGGEDQPTAEIGRGDVVLATLAGRDVLVRVSRVQDNVVHGAELVSYGTKKHKECVDLGATGVLHAGKAYIIGNARDFTPDKITRHWARDVPVDVDTIEEHKDNEEDT